MSFRSNRFLAVFLCAFLLFAQLGAQRHALLHASEGLAASSQTHVDLSTERGDEGCLVCLAFAAAGAVLVGGLYSLVFAYAHDAKIRFYFTHVLRRRLTAYLSRAPPVRLV